MLRSAVLFAILGITPVAAQAAELRECDEAGWGLSSLDLAPGGKGARFFADGKVTVLSLWREEPACCGAAVAFLFPVAAEEGDGYMRCMLASGYASLDVDRVKSAYDPKHGLMLSIPAKLYDSDTGSSKAAPPLIVMINLGEGQIRLGR